jgi:hypothetical protein
VGAISSSSTAPRDHGLVDSGVDLYEIGGAKLELHVEGVEPVVKIDRPFGERRDGVEPARLQQDAKAMRTLESAQGFEIRLGQWVEHAKHQHALAVRQGDLDLRDAGASRHAREQLSQHADQRCDRLGQHLTTLNIGDVLALLLPEPHQAAALLRHEPR